MPAARAVGAAAPAPAEPPAGAPATTAAMLADEGLDELLDGEGLVQVFTEEVREIIDALDGQLRAWPAAGPGADELALARRRLHTLKGSARMAGLAPLGDLSHAAESLLAGTESLAPATVAQLPLLLQRTLDALSEQLDAARQGAPLMLADTLVAELAAARSDAETTGIMAPAAPVPEPLQPAPAPPAAADPTPAPLPEATDTDTPTAPRDDPATQLRVGTDWLDAIINRSGEVGTYRARLVQQNARLGFRLAQLDDGLRRIGRRIDALVEAGPPALPVPLPVPEDEIDEVLPGLRESAALLAESRAVAAAIGELQRDNADLLRQQMRIAESLQDDLLGARMLPFGRIETRLARLVRRTAEDHGKRAQLLLRGADVALDRNVLERFVPALEHLLRNAVVHGIEPPATRAAQGKPPVGQVSIGVAREGNDVLIDIADDGAGMDPERLRERALAQGLIAADAQVSERELMALTLKPGFSTAAALTQDAGRGVGLDVVSTQVTSLNGELALASKPGRGARFSVRLPLTLSIVEALLVSAADTLLAVPHGTALAVARVERERLIAGDALVTYRGEVFPVEPIERALNPGAVPTPPQQRWLPVLLVAAGAERVAFQVDLLLESQRVVVKPLGPPLAALRWLSGGTVLPDGRVALLADLPALLRALRQPQAASPADTRPRVLVVDDSETVRRVAQRLLARENMAVTTARDGIEAQVMLRSRQPDLLLVDLDMPRLDGFQVIARARRLAPAMRIVAMSGDVILGMPTHVLSMSAHLGADAGRDPKTDLALIKVEGAPALPHVDLGNSADARIGDWVLAVGNPFGLGGSVNAGIISARGRDINSGPYDDYLQIDAQREVWLARGPLFDARGRVIGVNTAIYSPSGGNRPAVQRRDPATRGRRGLRRRESGRGARRGLGVQIQPVTEAVAASLGLDEAKGVLIADVLPDSPAMAAGVRSGDVILRAAGRQMEEYRDLTKLVAGIDAGTEVALEIVRGGKVRSLDVTIGRMPRHEADAEPPVAAGPGAPPPTDLDFSAAKAQVIEGFEREYLRRLLAETNGNITHAAQRAGIKAGSLISMVGQESVTHPDDIARAVREAAKQDRPSILLRVEQNGEQRFVAV